MSEHPWNDIVVDGHGNVYVNNVGFDFPGGEFAPGLLALVTPDGSVRKVADGLAFPNGVAVMLDNATLGSTKPHARVCRAGVAFIVLSPQSSIPAYMTLAEEGMEGAELGGRWRGSLEPFRDHRRVGVDAYEVRASRAVVTNLCGAPGGTITMSPGPAFRRSSPF